MANDITADILIIGTGVAGALAGAKLAAKGLTVAFLESGKRIDRYEAVERFWNAKIKVPESAYPNDPEAAHPLTHRIEDFYQQQGPELFKSTYIKVVGGTTWHWLGTTLRNLPSDFKMKRSTGMAWTGRSATTTLSLSTLPPRTRSGWPATRKKTSDHLDPVTFQ
jgi:choline dehydrogenase-like flavoprotein